MISRELRAGLVAFIVAASAWAARGWLDSSSSCGPPTDMSGCLGVGLLYVFVGLPAVVLLIAVGLRGRGVVNCLVGSAFGVAVGGMLTKATAHHLFHDSGSRGLDLTRSLVLGLATAGAVVAWARFGPDLRLTRWTRTGRQRDPCE